MTRERAKELLPIIKAFSEGKQVQHRNKGQDSWASWPSDDFIWMNTVEYRIKPEPSYRPWKPEEVPVGAVIKSKHGQVFIIMGRNGGDAWSVLISEINKVLGGWQSFDARDCTYSTDNCKTWLPCGVLVND